MGLIEKIIKAIKLHFNPKDNGMCCPFCGEKLKKDKKKAEGVWDCTKCNGVFFILVIRGEK